MAERVQREAWEHTSAMLAMTANVNRDPKKSRAFSPRDFNPFYARGRGGIPLTRKTIRMLKDWVPKRRGT